MEIYLIVWLAYLIVGLCFGIYVYVDCDKLDSADAFLAGVFWPILLVEYAVYRAFEPVRVAKKRRLNKAETLPIEDMSLHGRLPKPPRAGTLWEEEPKDRSCG